MFCALDDPNCLRLNFQDVSQSGIEARQDNEVGVGEKGDMHKNTVVRFANSLIKKI